MKAKHSVWKSKLAKTMFLMTVVLVAALFLGSAVSAGLRPQETKTQNNNNNTISALNKEYPVRADGLSTLMTKVSPTQHEPFFGRGYFYAYNAYDPSGTYPEGPITFDDPGAIEFLAAGIAPNFIAGADIDADGNWYGVDYAGGIYFIDFDGTMTYIAPSIGMNGLCFDSTSGTWFGSGANSLYTVDILTGTTTLVGAHGVTNTIIGIACDKDGNMYGYDVLFTGMSSLYSISMSTGAATVIGSMGVGFLYAQDCAYDRDNSILYIAGYTQAGTSGLYTCDVDTGIVTLVGAFEGGMEVAGFAIPWLPFQYDDDIAISGIVAPATGNAGPITPVVKVKNTGLYTEYSVPIQLEIGVEQITGTVEDFEANNGSYVHAPKIPQPDAWQWGAPTSGPMAAHSGSNLWATNLAGNYPVSMWCNLVTPAFIVPSGAMFNFWHWYYFEANYDGGNVKISTDGGTTWTLITPVGAYPGTMPYNPYMVGEPAFNGQSGGWKQANFDLSAYDGELVQIMFETASDSSVSYAGWYIDDVGFTITSWVNEYTQTATISSIMPDETLEVSFPTWTPADLGMTENTNINYNAEATNLFSDMNTNNDYKAKAFTLHFGYFDDVAVADIISPVNGLAKTQTPEVLIENHGQNAESVNVQMTIGKALYTTLLEEDFAGGVPPAGWGTNYPSNWISSATNNAGGTSPEAEFSWTPSGVDEFLLWTDVIDTTGFTALGLKFKEYVNDYNGDYTLKVVTSTDGGATWSTAYSRAGGPYGPATTDVTLTAANGVGSATFQVAWDFSGDSFNINYWYIDDVWIGIIDMVDEYDETVVVDVDAGASVNAILPDWTPSDVPLAESIDYLVNVEATLNGFTPVYSYGFEEAWIPAIPPGPPVFPPAGWTVINNNADTVLWSQYSSGPYSGTYCASIGYHYPTNDDWLTTQSVMIPSEGGNFAFWWQCGSTYYAEHFQVYYSTSGNTIADFTGPNGYLIGDITYNTDTLWHQFTYAMAGPEQVWFAVYCDSADALRLSVDDFAFPDGTTEGFEGGTPGIPGHWPSFDQYVYGTTTDQWLSVTSGSSPTCTPPEGTYMAKYNSYSISSGSAEIDGTVLIDFTEATQMKFKMMHDTGYNGSADVIYPLLSADGVNFWYDGTAFYRYDGTTGWKTETMDYSFLIDYLGGPGNYYIGFYAVSAFGNNIYIDDLNVVTFSAIPDGYPADNSLGAIVTLSYEHDAGVVAITEPSGTPAKDEAYLQYDNGVYSNAFGSTTNEIYGANRFTNAEVGAYLGWTVDTIMWKHYGAEQVTGDVRIYDAGTTSAPGALLTSEPFDVTGAGWFNITLSNPVTITGNDIWLCVHAFHQTSQYPLECSAPGISLKTAFFSSDDISWYDLPGLGYDVAFEIRGHAASGGGPGDHWLPGTYPVEGIIQNLGVTYPESDIPVNAQITNDTGVVVYDETVIVAGPLAPGETATVAFPDITIPSEPSAEGDYKLTMKTVLVGDDHPNNDKKILNFIIEIPDTTPPVTTATVSGTMGQNGWYVSNVQVTLTAQDFKWPHDVDYTMYKVDNGAWTIYTTPIVVSTDGSHKVYFYSVDTAVPPNTEDEQNVSFKMDKTAPVINAFTATPENAMKTKWLLEADATDPTSGIVLVEFYADDALVGSVTQTPYTFEVTYTIAGKPHTAQCIVYDAAGNSALSPVVVSLEVNSQQQQLYPSVQLLKEKLI